MRIVVFGGTGYVGLRLVPRLVEDGHQVVAASRTRPRHPSWGQDVSWVRCDVGEPTEVAAVLQGADAACFLVHSLDRRDFTAVDLAGARNVRDAVAGSTVRRLVYLSGLVPDEPESDLSEHLASRLAVEQELLSVPCSAVSLRAGVIIGAGSTSYEVIRQLATLLVIQPVPLWLRARVQPIAVSDAVRALVDALDSETLEGTVDIGGPDVVRYPRLLAAYSWAARLPRARVPVLVAPRQATARATAAMVAAPYRTVLSLLDSLRHDLVCRPGHTWEPADGEPLSGIRAAMRRAVRGEGMEAALPGDPDWTRLRAPVLDELHAPASARAAASLLVRRLRALTQG